MEKRGVLALGRGREGGSQGGGGEITKVTGGGGAMKGGGGCMKMRKIRGGTQGFTGLRHSVNSS